MRGERSTPPTAAPSTRAHLVHSLHRAPARLVVRHIAVHQLRGLRDGLLALAAVLAGAGGRVGGAGGACLPLPHQRLNLVPAQQQLADEHAAHAARGPCDKHRGLSCIRRLELGIPHQLPAQHGMRRRGGAGPGGRGRGWWARGLALQLGGHRAAAQKQPAVPR